MNTNTQTKEQRQKRFFREHFEELRKFITNSDLTHDGSPMHALLKAYDFDKHGRELYMKEGDGHSKEEAEIEFEKRKQSCKWETKGVEERDILSGIETFFSLTSASSGFEESLAAEFSTYRDLIFDVYFKLPPPFQEMKSKHVYEVDKRLSGLLEEIFRQEKLLAQILKYFGIARNDNGYGIGESQSAFESFAKKYSEVAKDESCNNFDTAFHLLRTVRNIYAVHGDKTEEEQKKDYVSFSKFLYANVPGALRFLIYFYVTLCTLVNRAWRKANELEENNRKKGFPIMSQSNYKSKNSFNLVNPLFTESNINVCVNVKFIPLTGQTIESVFNAGQTVDVQPEKDGSVMICGLKFSREKTLVFVVNFSQPKHQEKTYKANLCNHKIWDGTTIVFSEGEGETYEYEEDVPTGEAEKPSITDQEKAAEGNASKEEEKVSYNPITQYCDGWRLEFWPGFYSETSDEEEHTCYLYSITSKGYKNRIVIPQYTYRNNPFIEFRVDFIHRNFWNELGKYGGVLVGIPENIDYDIDHVPDNVDVFTSKNWYPDEKFSFKAKDGHVFKCEYKKDDECSIIGLEEGKEKLTAEIIEIPRYACGLLVTGIGDKAFVGVKANEIILPNSVQAIGKGAFSGSSIWRMCFPENVREINAHMFENCELLQTFETLGEIEDLGEYAFAGCKALELVNLKSLRSKSQTRYSLEIHRPNRIIPKGAFLNCHKLKSVYLDVKQIKEKAFMGCTGLTEVNSYVSVENENFFTEEIGESAFAHCVLLDSIFGADKSNFIALFERNPHRKKLVRVFEPNEELLHVDRFSYIINRLVGVVIVAVTIYWVGRYFGWW